MPRPSDLRYQWIEVNVDHLDQWQPDARQVRVDGRTVTGLPGYWRDDLAATSHGEGFIAILGAMFAAELGLYLLDEP